MLIEVKELLPEDGVVVSVHRKVAIAIQDADQIEKIYLNRSVIDANDEDNYYPSIKTRYADRTTSPQLVGFYTSPSEPEILQLMMNNRKLYLKVREQDRPIPLYPQENNTFASLDYFIVLNFSPDQSYSEIKLKISFLNDEYDYAKAN